MNRKHSHAKESKDRNGDQNRPSSAIGLDDKSVATYYDLSNHLRHAVSRGYPKASRQSHKQSVHNLQVSKMFLAEKENVDSPYRRQKDWLSKFFFINFLFTYL